MFGNRLPGLMETLVLTSHGNILQIGEGVVKDFFLARGNFLDKPPSQREAAEKPLVQWTLHFLKFFQENTYKILTDNSDYK